jgi:hypothetical protein
MSGQGVTPAVQVVSDVTSTAELGRMAAGACTACLRMVRLAIAQKSALRRSMIEQAPYVHDAVSLCVAERLLAVHVASDVASTAGFGCIAAGACAACLVRLAFAQKGTT